MVCNSGVSLIPEIEGKAFHFVNSGLYDALFIMEDEETKTLWNHVTGEGLYGPHAGYRMPVANLLQMNVSQALDLDPEMQIAISDQPYLGEPNASATAYSPDNEAPQLMEMFTATLGKEDARLPRMEMGLGVWSDATQRYYPAKTLRQHGKMIIDVFEGRKLLVYVDSATSTMAAIYVDSSGARFGDGELLLDNGHRVRAGRIVNENNQPVATDRPQQIFTRWYGFSLTFPKPEIFE